MGVRVGFTGTRKGMSANQKVVFRYVMSRFYDVDEFHHGDCIGADHEAAKMILDMGDIDTVTPHPAGNDPLGRDKQIVALSDILIAAPRTDKEELRSGTWATVRYARTKGIAVVMLPRGKE